MKNTLLAALLFCWSAFAKAQAPTMVTGEIEKHYGDSPSKIDVQSNSPGAISFSLLSGDAISVTSDGEVTVLKVGSAVVQVSQEASPPFLAGTQNINVVVKKASPITSIVSPNKVNVGGKIQLQAQSYPPGANYTWSILSQSGTNAGINGSELLAGNNAGTLNVKAELIPDENFEAVISTSTFSYQVITVVDTGGQPKITFQDMDAHYGDHFQLQASSNSPGAITYSIVSGTAATVTSDGWVTATEVGSVVIQLDQAADGSFGAGSKTATLTIGKAYPRTRIISESTVLVGDKIQLQAESDPPGAKYSWSIASQSGTQATLNGSELLAGNASGTLNVKAELISDEHFQAGVSTSTLAYQQILVRDTSGLPKLVFNDFTATYGMYPFLIQATSNSPGRITYSVLSGNAATIDSNGIVTIIDVGTVEIRLSQAASGSFGAITKTAVLTVEKANPYATILSANKVGTGNKLLLEVQSYPPGAKYAWSIVSQTGTAASLSGDTLIAGSSIGSLNVLAELIPDDHFEAITATSTSQSLSYASQTIQVVGTSGVPTITFGNLTTKYYGDSAFYLDVHSPSPGAISYRVVSGDAATVDSAGKVTIKGVGVVTIQVSQEASPPYEAVTYNTQLRIEGSVVTDINNELLSNGLSVYPNPAKDVLYVAIPKGASDGDVETQLYHLNGTVSSPHLQNGIITLSDLEPGIYLLKIKYRDKEVHHRVVKQ